MFQPNESFLMHYYASHPHSGETLVDFGMVPSDPRDREDWCAEVARFLGTLILVKG